MMNASREPNLYHVSFDHLMLKTLPESLHGLGTVALKVAESGGSCLKGPNGVRRSTQSNVIRDYIIQGKQIKI